MTTETETIYLFATISSFRNEPRLMISETDMSTLPEYVLIDQKEISFDVPDLSIVNGALVIALEEKIAEMRAVSTAAIAEVQAQIQSLMALENQNV